MNNNANGTGSNWDGTPRTRRDAFGEYPIACQPETLKTKLVTFLVCASMAVGFVCWAVQLMTGAIL